jgi:hypothetical protein
MDMAIESDILSYSSPPTPRQWVAPLARRVAATLMVCALIFIGLSQVVVRKSTLRQAPDGRGPYDQPFRTWPEGGSKTVEFKSESTPEQKHAPISPSDYKLHLDQ